MSRQISNISALQKLGSAVHQTKQNFSAAVLQTKKRLSIALDKDNSTAAESLMNAWKTENEISNRLSAVEVELAAIYKLATEAVDHLAVKPSAAVSVIQKEATRSSKPTRTAKAVKTTTKAKVAKAKPATKAEVSVAVAEVTPAKAATKAKLTPKAKAPAKKPVAKKTKVKTSAVALKPGSNADRLLAHMTPQLNADAFSDINMTNAAQELGIPLGSMTAATKKLVESGQVVAGPEGYKLATATTA